MSADRREKTAAKVPVEVKAKVVGRFLESHASEDAFLPNPFHVFIGFELRTGFKLFEHSDRMQKI